MGTIGRCCGVLLLLVSVQVGALPLEYKIEFTVGSASSGVGYFTYDDDGDLGEELIFFAVFDVGNEYESIAQGGGAGFLNALFLNELVVQPQGTNFDDAEGFVSLLSIESTGVYCLREFVGASGLCSEDPGVFELGEWSVLAVVPEPSTIGLFGLGLLGLVLHRRKANGSF